MAESKEQAALPVNTSPAPDIFTFEDKNQPVRCENVPVRKVFPDGTIGTAVIPVVHFIIPVDESEIKPFYLASLRSESTDSQNEQMLRKFLHSVEVPDFKNPSKLLDAQEAVRRCISDPLVSRDLCEYYFRKILMSS